MKRTLFLTAFAAIVGALPAVGQQQPEALWGKAVQGTLGTKVTSQGYDMQLAPDGGVYICGGAGTKTTDDIVRFGNDQIAAPATPYFGNGDVGNQNLFVSKIAADGMPLWTLYSRNGSVLSGNTFMQPVADGLLVVTGIEQVSKMATKSVVIVDASGQETDLQWALATDDASRHYRFVVMKLSAQGTVQWLRQIDAADTKEQGLALYGMATDAAGNIFLAGEQRADLYIPTANGAQTTLTAGRSADFFLLKLDADGYYQKHLTMDGELTEAKVRSMCYSHGHFYLMGTLTAAQATQATLGGHVLTLTNSYATPYVASVDANLTVEWAKATAADGQNFNMQQNGLCASGDALWLCGMASVAVTTQAGKALKIGEGLNRVATLLKFSLTDGTLLDGYLSSVFQTGYFSVFEDTDGYIYAAGYEGILRNRRSANGSLHIDRFSPADLSAPLLMWDGLIQSVGGGQATRLDADGHLYTMTRNNTLPNALLGGTLSVVQDYAGYCCNVCAFQLPIRPVSAIAGVHADRRNGDSAYYTLSGLRTERPSRGIYIHRGRKVVVQK